MVSCLLITLKAFILSMYFILFFSYILHVSSNSIFLNFDTFPFLYISIDLSHIFISLKTKIRSWYSSARKLLITSHPTQSKIQISYFVIQSQWLHFPQFPCLTIIVTLSFCSLTPATLTSLLFLDQATHALTSELLYFLSLLPAMFFC